MKGDCILIKINGYEATVDGDGLIIECNPRLDKIKHMNITEVFEKYNLKVKFEKMLEIPYPPLVKDEVYNRMVTKNKILAELRDKFDCEIY